MNLRRLLYIAAAAAVLGSACSLEYQEMAESLDDETPSLRMSSVTVVTVEEGWEKFRIKAESLEDYDNTLQRIIQGADFTEYNSDGEVSAQGRADRIEFDTRSDNAVLEGSISFTSVSDKTTVAADYLEWNDKDRRLSGKPEGEVFLERDNGTRIQGFGFSADFPSRVFRFSRGVSGRYVFDSEESSEESP
ncbi:LPS export ABC transporter periplasmic protein LptC [Marispirochaeta sp.]|uniref:LPS export ABC transporter periplasmic protein LptC n=1 Tax=Marispirochaeta sp. TaxID=2038653 RepID=UPI0029C6AD80|nr:LPS export ABC transporter periplasmic protein LptC [Marispirochaeta sp.]